MSDSPALTPDFVHLRAHTEYSVVDGILRIDDWVDAAADDGQAALGISDLNNLFGTIKFYKACRGAGLKPLIGADVWLAPVDGDGVLTRLLLIAQNPEGYHHLCELLSLAWLGEPYEHQACVQLDDVQAHSAGLIALSGGATGWLGRALAGSDPAQADRVAQRLEDIFPGRFYIELQRAGLPGEEDYIAAALPLAARLQLPVVATHPMQFLTQVEFDAHEARVCVAEGDKVANPARVRRFTPQQHALTRAQMHELFADIPSALANTVAIAQRCTVPLVLGQPRLPDFPTPPLADGSAMPIADYFRQLSQEGLEDRLARRFPVAAQRDAQRPTYQERLDFEIGTILKMGFPGYFLIVADFIRWAKSHGCPVGPGRGSGAGSLVAYALGITDLDPLQYKLLFERFLNPERVSMPDFDIDFCQSNRDRVIDYVKERYGRQAVSQIATFGTMAAKAALRDIGRVLDMSYGQVDGIAKLIPAPPGKTVTLAKVPEKPSSKLIYARLEAPELNEREANEEDVAILLERATQVEGLVRNVGMHAGGVLIAPGKITDFTPLYQQPGSDKAVSQFDKDDVEAAGLVKFDFLGLATLTILEEAKKHIQRQGKALAEFDFEQIPLDDTRTYKLFAEGRTEAVFQFESTGMQRMLRDAKPSRLEDLIALNALYRPGPMDLIPSFVARKHGDETVEYPHPSLESVLSETYGIMVYQEQVMQTAQILGGYSLGGADLLRRAMGKKKPEEMAQHRLLFREGAAKNGIAQAQADEVFDLMEKFAGYGFNKSHAAAYSLLAYHTAWVKVHHTCAFFAANMTVEMDNTDKLKVLRDDAVDFGIVFDPPDVNQGTHAFEPLDKTRLRYGLGAVKGTGKGAIEAIVAARGDTPFTSLFDFCHRVDRTRVNRRVIEALIRAGAFDSLHPDRAPLLASLGLAFDWAEQQAINALQGDLFAGDSHSSADTEPPLLTCEPWSVRERLMQEKIAIGFFLTGHLFEEHAAEIASLVDGDLASITPGEAPVCLAGLVSDSRTITGNRGKVLIFSLDDGSGRQEASLNEEQIARFGPLIREDELIVILARVRQDRFSGGVRLNIQAVWDLPTARALKAAAVRVCLTLPQAAQEQDSAALLDGLTRLAREWPVQPLGDEGSAGLPLQVQLSLPQDDATVCGLLELGPASRFWPGDDALTALRRHLRESGWPDGSTQVQVQYRRGAGA
ncbi:DNA polymerase III subunit alpha [Amphibiibacter pelophylacis]|uniref:DNA polymerase III subunit alpha n=1 Tax=Amphibiibacter pelophylacis TaxID=1799477 RepID=A0ACC6P3A3_9BURK